MKNFKFFLLWIILTLIMVISWSMGFLIADGITHAVTPPPKDASKAFLSFLMVCSINSLLLSVLIWATSKYSGLLKNTTLILYCFVIQFFLTQMETLFFSESIGIENNQVASIVIAGLSASFVTVLAGILIANAFRRREPKTLFVMYPLEWRQLILPLIILASVVYPAIYLIFGHFIAWQNENLRIYYTQSSELNSFLTQFGGSFADGIYFFQILRGLIWVVVSIPLILMLQNTRIKQYLLIAALSSLLPATLLFIPNPYMPEDIAMTHFIEISTSNFLWGLVMTYTINKYLRPSAIASSQRPVVSNQ